MKDGKILRYDHAQKQELSLTVSEFYKCLNMVIHFCFFTLLTSENVFDRFRLPAFKDTLRVRTFIPVAGRST